MIEFQADHPDYPTRPFTTPIWRHMDYMQFVSLLAKRALHFARASTLPDPFEGVLTPSPRRSNAELVEIQERLRESTFLNCWYEGDEESAAMWERQPDGVAIKSGIGSLSRSIRVVPGMHIYMGRVRYIDYDKEPAPLDKWFSHFLYKRTSYSHECEIRAMARSTKRAGQKREDLPLELAPPHIRGIYVDVDLDLLVDQVVASPTTPDYVFEALESVVKAYGLDCPVARSSLTEPPPLG